MDAEDYELRCPLCGSGSVTVSEEPRAESDEFVLRKTVCDECGHRGTAGTFVVP